MFFDYHDCARNARETIELAVIRGASIALEIVCFDVETAEYRREYLHFLCFHKTPEGCTQTLDKETLYQALPIPNLEFGMHIACKALQNGELSK